MTDTSGRANVSGAPAGLALDRVAVRIPEFCPDDPEMWFSMVESSFDAAGITAEKTKFGYVMGALSPRYAKEVRDIIVNPPATQPYQKLKVEFIRRLRSSQQQKTRRLLEHEEIGDRKPSQFLRHLRELAGTSIDDNVLRTLWASRLPAGMQGILATQRDTELDKVAELADAVAETLAPRAHITEAAAPSASSTPIAGPSTMEQNLEALLGLKMAQLSVSLRQEISAIRQEFATEERRPRRGWSRRPSYGGRHRRRSASRSVERDADGNYEGMCWYHRRYGRDAHQCIRPCNWASAQGNDQGNR
ncbi:uncharacterized protein LOC143211618 [Lasioglossum baleicum]|uniref:uncharacterized protein LOC143211618 n=1 Tax=Lasioglossum baleicum TaxID=434251 RepID=UPI003FCD3417